jgi:pimeloyl-ACP methyl ester carboxylesterase
MADHKTRFFMAPSIKPQGEDHALAVHEWGDRDNPRVLFCVHGLTRNAMDFAVLAAALCDRWRVIAVDMPGRGQSDWLIEAAEYVYPTYVADLLALLDRLALGSVDWLGTSMGGIIGMMMAGLAPDRIGRLVLNDAGAWIPAAGLRRILAYAGRQMEFATRGDAERALRTNCAPFGIRTEENWQRLFTSSLLFGADGRTRMAYDPAITSAFPAPEEAADIDLWPVWEAVACPTLIVRGVESDILLRETADEMCSRRGGVTLIELTGAGHAPSLMEPDQIAPIARWLG